MCSVVTLLIVYLLPLTRPITSAPLSESEVKAYPVFGVAVHKELLGKNRFMATGDGLHEKTPFEPVTDVLIAKDTLVCPSEFNPHATTDPSPFTATV
ncbi:hypothetical protein ASN18_3344 [Candidatus Magnetominusculus xianensis]|uniref:Secreted protein n=1 Tax=Candidatus Magnetominusculus xianensis TaxID=1748249 RepID=A0ABR5SAQ1_9BACT|nr:hypothetical protein ASN18_3344 [Candidatus Magnetominusculus xianensis]